MAGRDASDDNDDWLDGSDEEMNEEESKKQYKHCGGKTAGSKGGESSGGGQRMAGAHLGVNEGASTSTGAPAAAMGSFRTPLPIIDLSDDDDIMDVTPVQVRSTVSVTSSVGATPRKRGRELSMTPGAIYKRKKRAEKEASESPAERMQRLKIKADGMRRSRSEKKGDKEEARREAERKRKERSNRAEKKAKELRDQDAERKRKERDERDEDKAKELRDQDAERKRKERAERDEDEAEELREQNAERMRKERAERDEDEAEEKREQNAERMRKERAERDEDEAKELRDQDAERKRKERDERDEDEAEEERQRDADRHRQQYNNMSNTDHLAACERRKLQYKLRKKQKMAAFNNIGVDNPEAVGVEPYDQGRMDIECPLCGALMFEYELLASASRKKPAFGTRCCRNGKITFTEALVPTRSTGGEPTMWDVLTPSTPLGSVFHKYCIELNRAFAMTSVMTTLERPEGQGVRTYKIRGPVQHLRGGLEAPKTNAKYMAIYSLSPHDQVQRRVDLLTDKKKMSANEKQKMEKIIKIIMDYLVEHNEHVKLLHTRAEMQAANINVNPQPQFNVAFFNSLDRRARKTIDMPSSNEAGAIFVTTYDGKEPAALSFTREKAFKEIALMSSSLEPMRWPLLFLDGRPGWCPKTTLTNGEQLKMHQYHKFMVHDRLPREDNGVVLPQHGSMLFAAYLTVEHARCEANTLEWHTKHHANKRTDTKEAVDEAADGDGYLLPDGVGVMTAVRLSKSFVGGGRYYYDKLAASFRHAEKYGPCHLFLTMTGNPEWPEIKEGLRAGETWTDRPVLCAKAFHGRSQRLLQLIMEAEVLGEVAALDGVYEYQMRGMMHLHTLITLKKALRTAEDIDKVVQAYLPKDPKLRGLVKKLMVHTCCDTYCRKDLPKNKKRCLKGFPMPMTERTEIAQNGHTHYRRPAGAEYEDDHPRLPNEKMTSADITSTNMALLKHMECHLNLESVLSPLLPIYLYRYITKGSDKTMFTLNTGSGNLLSDIQANADKMVAMVAAANLALNMPPVVRDTTTNNADGPSTSGTNDAPTTSTNTDKPTTSKDGETTTKDEEKKKKEGVHEPNEYIGGRNLQPQQAAAHHLGIEPAWNYPPVKALEVHLPGKQLVYFDITEEDVDNDDDNNNEDAVKMKRVKPVAAAGIDRVSTLMAFFETNKRDPDARQWLYTEMPEHYTFGKGKWKKRQRAVTRGTIEDPALGRLHAANTHEGERYYMRWLLLTVRGPTSFEDLRSHNGTVYASYKEACIARGMLTDDELPRRTMQEATIHLEPRQLRSVFVQMLLHLPKFHYDKIFTEFKDAMSVDIKRKRDKDRATNINDSDINATLKNIGKMLDRHGRTLGEYKLPDRVGDGSLPANMLDDDAPATGGDVNVLVTLDEDQRALVSAVLAAVDNKKSGLFALDAPAGYGKTKTLNALIEMLKTRKKTIAVTAASGVAAQLLIDGRTVHSTFRVPAREFDENHVLGDVKPNNRFGRLVKALDAVVIDEIYMLDKHVLMAIDRAFKYIRGNDEPMGGVVAVFGGDVRQVLPVLPFKCLMEVKTRIVKCTPWWSAVKKFQLSKNYRVRRAYGQDKKGADEWANYLLDVGNGAVELQQGGPDDKSKTPCINVPADLRVNSVGELINFVFGDGNDFEAMASRAILAPYHEQVDAINATLMARLPGDKDSADPAMRAKHHVYYSHDDYVQQTSVAPQQEEMWLQKPQGYPDGKLELRVGAIVQILRNLNIERGLCNGARAIVKELRENYVVVKLLSPPPNVKPEEATMAVPRIVFMPDADDVSPLRIKRGQIPLAAAFAATVHRAQGSTLDKVGVCIDQPMFTHGQLYVALSRVGHREKLKIYIGDPTKHSLPEDTTANFVERDVL